jgi:flagellar basal-body rod protein FlgB
MLREDSARIGRSPPPFPYHAMPTKETQLFTAVKLRLEWLGARQQVLARNVANADTPGYQAADLADPNTFGALVRNRLPAATVASTDPRHMAASFKATNPIADRLSGRSGEVSISGNGVNLEEQMAKISETALQHRLTTQLYHKYLGMLRVVTTAKG